LDSTLVDLLLKAGIPGVVLLMILLGWLVPKWAYDDVRAERDELKAENAQLRAAAGASVTGLTATRDILAAIQYGHDLTTGQQP
jgi:hypothetical protein